MKKHNHPDELWYWHQL